jgi:16S rRNA (cytosine967-C5)-methyltransferase
VFAIDLHARKAQLIAEAAKRLGLDNLEARAADATLPIPGEPPESFDLVLADAPCSGLGTIRRHPEVKLRRTAEDSDRLAALQAKILAQLSTSVRRGGLLVYAVCTLLPEECDEQVERFLAAHPGFREDPPTGNWCLDPTGECLDARGRLRTLPDRTGTDGFFAVRLRKEQ